MRNKITRKLILYFFIIVIANSLIASGIFMVLSRKAYVDVYKDDLARRADNIAQGIAANMDILTSGEGEAAGRGRRGEGRSDPNQMRMSPKYLNWMDQVLDGKVWLIYKTDKVFQRGNLDIQLSYEDLSDHEKDAIDQAFEGRTITTESFDSIFEEGTVSAVAPLRDTDGAVYGAILIHENISLAKGFIDSAFYILLISVLSGMFIALIMVVFFVQKFVQPINQIDAAAKVMIGGDYQVKTDVIQDDEIGDLARNMDELASRLEKSRQEGENLDRMRNDFISNMSHELKTPVTVMKASLEGLVSGVIPEAEIGDYHHLLYEEISVLDRLVMDLMELNAVKNRNFPMKFQEEDLISILKDAARSQRILANERGLEMVLEIEDPYHMMDCEYTRMRQMFITVINNGIKYSDPGEPVIIREFKDGDKVKIQVINKGKAIDPEDRDHLFESFYRAKDAPEKGFGLGLTIAKEIADRHAIDLHVLSGSKGETIFEFVI